MNTNELLKTLPIIAYWINEKKEYIGHTQLFEKKLGLQSIADTQKKINTILSWQAEEDSLIQLEKKALQTKNIETCFQTLNFPDGKQYCKIVAKVIKNQDVINIFVTITENNEEFEKLIDSIPCNLYWKNNEGIYQGCNISTVKMFGCKSKEEIIGKKDNELMALDGINNNLAATYINIDNEVITKNISKLNVEELPFSRADGKTIHLLTNKAPLTNNEAESSGVIGVSIDITELKNQRDILIKKRIKAEKTAQSALKNLERVIASMPESVYWKSDKGIYLGCNDAMAKMLGLPKSEILGKSDRYFSKKTNIPKETIRKFVDDDKKVMKTGIPKVNIEELPLRSIDGKLIHQMTSKVPIKDEKNKVVGIVGISVDITEKKELEEKLRQASIREERLKVLSSMGGMIAHELRTPMTAIGLAVSAINEYLPTLFHVYKQWSTEKNEFLISPLHLHGLTTTCDDISHSLAQADETIDMILNGFKPNELTKKELSLVSLDELMKTLLSEYPLISKESKLITVKPSGQLKIWCSKRIIIYVLTNLLKNAFYFISETGKGKVTIWADTRNNNTHLHIKDTAKGIAKDKLDKIFEPFYTSKYYGTSIGMGLYFCKMALESMGATIHCNAVLGEFTEFIVTLPKQP